MKESGQTAASTPQPAPKRKRYEQPQLVRYGTMRDLTAAAIKPAAGADVVSLS